MDQDEFQRSTKKELHLNKPKWLKTKIPTGSTLFQIKRDLRSKNLYTVCEEAKCPNITECWAQNTATLMILGDTCTRACRFCNVKTGNPLGFLDSEEPEKTAHSVSLMQLKYVVITMVDRDDLQDGGADHIAKVFSAIRQQSPTITIEFLGGDFGGNEDSLATVLSTTPEVFAHNIETIERLTPRVRDARSSYGQSLEVLRKAKEMAAYPLLTKSAIMAGLGESRSEVEKALKDLRLHGVDIVTIGQYMRPTKKHLSIKEWVHPDQFKEYEKMAFEMGFLAVAAGPLVRSSYRANHYYEIAIEAQKQR